MALHGNSNCKYYAGPEDSPPGRIDPPNRTEQPILQMAAGLLRRSPYLPLRGIRCELTDGVLTLHGRVPTCFLKQLAQTLAMTVPGIDHVANRIDVLTLSARSTQP